jgi:hypothetical protein
MNPCRPGKVVYPIHKALVLCLLALLGEAKALVAASRFGEKKIAPARRFRPFRDGTP